MKNISLFFVLVLLIGLASAEINVNYNVVEEKVLVSLEFGDVENLEYKIPYDARTIESSSDYTIFEDVFYVEKAQDLRLSYITNAFIEKTKDDYFFILKNNFEESVNMKLILPEGGILHDEGIMFPDADKISSDGRRIILEWNNFNSEEAVISYEVIEKSNTLIAWVLILLVIIFAGFYFYQARKTKFKIKKIKKRISRKTTRKHKKKMLVANLFGEEKKIIEYLLGRKKGESWTKEIVRDLGISKVRLSRRLRNLEQKELIEKIPFGNENRIRLLKKK